MLHLESDETLVERVKKGNQGAFSQLVHRHQETVYSICYRMTGNAAEAEDLAQEAFLRFYRGLNSFRAGACLRPWLHKITTNVCLDALRRCNKATLPLEELIEGENHPQVRSVDELPEDACLSRETQLDVQSALLRLPGDYRVVLVLRYLDDLSYQEIAQVLDVPVSTVETRLFRAKQMLGRVLAPKMWGKKEGGCST